MYRIAHITDLHVMRRPRFTELLGKRLLGTTNLYLLGRKNHFSAQVQEAVVTAVLEQAPDALICTGDVTAQATEEEFDAARDLLRPLLCDRPVALVPGNHDTYTRDAFEEAAMSRWFDEWMGSGPYPRRFQLGQGVSAWGLDVCKAGLLSDGLAPMEQIDALDAQLAAERKDGVLFVMLHYPLRNRRGGPYGPWTRALRNARALEAVLLKHADKIDAILHGHEHHGFRTCLGQIPIFNPGACGYAWMPKKRRTAHFNVYEIEAGRIANVLRFAYDGQQGRFLPEAGGAYRTGG